MNSLARVTAQGAYVPNKVLDNYELLEYNQGY
mgnify:CR=1 FL=1